MTTKPHQSITSKKKFFKRKNREYLSRYWVRTYVPGLVMVDTFLVPFYMRNKIIRLSPCHFNWLTWDRVQPKIYSTISFSGMYRKSFIHCRNTDWLENSDDRLFVGLIFWDPDGVTPPDFSHSTFHDGPRQVGTFRQDGTHVPVNI